MSDARILGNSDIVDSVISQSDEKYEPRYGLKPQGFDPDRIAGRFAEVLDMEPQEVFSNGRQNWKVTASILPCFWPAREFGMSHTAL